MSTFAALVRTVLALAGFLDSLMRGLNDRRARQAGEDKAAASSLKEQTARVQKARAARRSVDPDRVPDDDPYRRD